MKHIKLISVSVLTILLFQSINFAQLNEYAYKLGIQGSYVSPDTYFSAEGLSLQIRPFLRFELGSIFDLGIGAGYGWMKMKDNSGNEVKTTIIPADIRLLFSPIESKIWNPYLTAGIGAVYWKNETRPINPAPSTTIDNNTDIYTPLGAGAEFALGESLILDLHAVANLSWTELMTGYNPKDGDELLKNDAWWTFGIGFAYSSESCSKDSDNDGIGDCDERELGLDPNNSDSDEDDIKDGEELNKYNTDPLNADSDGDNLKDGEEVFTYNTNPLEKDSDKDMLNDFAEVITYKSDPLNIDTDSDKLTDGDEVNKFKTDPTSNDTDLDKLNDYDELNVSKTNPLIADSDSDGLLDGDEVDIYKTNPNEKDSDSDRISDGDEVDKYKTNPLLADTDIGGIDDYLEIQLEKNPLDPADDIESIELEIVFGLNSSKLNDLAISKLEKILPKAKEIIKLSDSNIEIQGHTDSRGSANGNQRISEKRAKAVYDWLVSNGIPKNRINYKGYGETKPKYSNKTREGRAKNRRIELFIEPKK